MNLASQPSLWDLAPDDSPREAPRSPAAAFLAEIEARMRRADQRSAQERTEFLNGHLFWSLIRALQPLFLPRLREATDHYLDGRRAELSPVLGSQADEALHGWLNPKRRTVNVVGGMAEATTILQLLGDGHPHSDGPFNRVIAVGDPSGDVAWRSVAPWWQGDLRRNSWRVVGPGWVPWCDRIPPGAPTGTLVVRPGLLPDHDAAVADLAAWYRTALETGRRWVCPHGWTHHPRRGDRTEPHSCHRRHHEEPCDRCCLLSGVYGAAS